MKAAHLLGFYLMLASLLALAQNPVPFVNQPLVPGAAVPGGPGFTLTINGANFVSGATVNWNRSPRATTFVSSSQLTASISASDIATGGSAQVTVSNAGSLGSAPVLFPIVSPTTGAGFSFTENSSTVFPVAPVEGDFDGDGKPDLVVSDITGGYDEESYTVLLGNGDGTFKTPNPVTLSGVTHLQLALAADVNGDGKLDLFGVDNEGALSAGVVMLGNGDGTFQSPQTFLLGGQLGSFVVADFNRDGKVDIAGVGLVGNATQLSVFLGNGNGTFQSPIGFAGNGGLAVGDFDGDGILDLLAGGQVFLGNGDGTFTAGQVISGHGTALAVADLNGDGKLDAIFKGEFGFTVLLGNGDGTFTAEESFATGNLLAVLSLGDFNGDGKVDVVAGGFDGMSTLLGNGDGTFQPSYDFGVAPWVSLIASQPVVADFNADGYQDVVFPTRFNSANTTLAVVLGTTVQLSPMTLFLGDINVGTIGLPQDVTITNFASTSLVIGSVSLGGANANQFSLVANNCGTSLASGGSCTVSVSCSPTLTGNLSASLLFTDSVPASPQSVLMTCFGIGTTPMAQFSPASLTFAAQLVGTTSPLQSIVMTNTGNANLDAAATIVGTNPGDFSRDFSACGGELLPGHSCTIKVDFTPSGLGTRSAQLEVVSNAPNSPQSIPLTGTGAPNLGLGVSPGKSSSATVNAGGTASYTLSIGGAGTSGAATLTCTGAPKDATCTVPASEDLSDTTPTTFTVSVKTAARTSASLVPHSPLVWCWAAVVIGVTVLPVATGKGRRASCRLGAFSILLILFLTSCGGSSSGGGGGGSSTGTPAGTYTLTVTAAMGSTQQLTALTLTVR